MSSTGDNFSSWFDIIFEQPNPVTKVLYTYWNEIHPGLQRSGRKTHCTGWISYRSIILGKVNLEKLNLKLSNKSRKAPCQENRPKKDFKGSQTKSLKKNTL